MIDIHHHLLYGLDDGPADRAQMERMVVAASPQCIRTLIATPPSMPGIVPFSQEIMENRLLEAQKACVALGLALQVLPGVEMLFTPQAGRYLAQQQVPTLAGTRRLLVEFGTNIRYCEMEQAIQTVLRNGLLPVLAHIERYPCLMGQPRRIALLRRRYDVLVQVNAGALLRGGRGLASWRIRCLLEAGAIDCIASDAHDTQTRGCHMAEAYRRLAALVGVAGADALTGNHLPLPAYLKD